MDYIAWASALHLIDRCNEFNISCLLVWERMKCLFFCVDSTVTLYCGMEKYMNMRLCEFNLEVNNGAGGVLCAGNKTLMWENNLVLTTSALN